MEEFIEFSVKQSSWDETSEKIEQCELLYILTMSSNVISAHNLSLPSVKIVGMKKIELLHFVFLPL